MRENGLIDESSGNNVKKLQLERKKRAMEFLNHLKSEDPKESVHRKSRKHSSDKKESSRRHKSSKRSRKRYFLIKKIIVIYSIIIYSIVLIQVRFCIR